MQIINIIEIQDGVISNITSFTIPEGCLVEYREKKVKAAEDLFEKLARELKSDFVMEELEDNLDDGYFEYNGCEIQLIWSHQVN